jgi:hypothetical protein
LTYVPSVSVKEEGLDEKRCKELFLHRDDQDWYHYVVLGKNVDDEVMQKYLDYYRLRDNNKQLKVAAFASTVSEPMYVVKIEVLPANLRDLIRRIDRSWTVVDNSARPDEITGAAHGSIRAWHQNGDNFLPPLQPLDEHAIVATGYKTYVEEHKHLPTKQIKKGIKEEYTGYVEYTILSWRSTQGRMVYDYYNNRFYVTPGHYGSGDKSRNAFFLVELD